MKYKVLDIIWHNGARYEIGAEVEMDEAQAKLLAGIVEALPQSKQPKDPKDPKDS